MKDDDTPYPGAGGYALLWPNRLFIDRMFPHREKKSQFWKQSNQQIKMAGFICLDVGSDVGTQSKNECFTYAVRIPVFPPYPKKQGVSKAKPGNKPGNNFVFSAVKTVFFIGKPRLSWNP
ncbi:MAG: hypothetical protein IPH54_15690 [Rhodoferax sp.]|nr:hypothetical protein [Rhodoferax sp.]